MCRRDQFGVIRINKERWSTMLFLDEKKGGDVRRRFVNCFPRIISHRDMMGKQRTEVASYCITPIPIVFTLFTSDSPSLAYTLPDSFVHLSERPIKPNDLKDLLVSSTGMLRWNHGYCSQKYA